MSKPPVFIPRSSSLGAYLLCDYRAALDRAAIEAGEVPGCNQSSAYADLGTCIHYRLQTTMGCIFPKDHEGPPEQAILDNAANLFNNDPTRTEQAIQKAAGLAMVHMPRAPDGQLWLAELAVKAPRKRLTGHIDFLSQDRTTIVDLKTTSRKPDHNRMKGEHLAQLVGYKIMVPEATTGHILYVDGPKAQWAMLVSVDFTNEYIKEYITQIHDYIGYLRSKQLFVRCTPRIGSHCQSTFCPHVATCRDKVLPPAGVPVEVDKAIHITSTGPL